MSESITGEGLDKWHEHMPSVQSCYSRAEAHTSGALSVSGGGSGRRRTFVTPSLRDRPRTRPPEYPSALARHDAINVLTVHRRTSLRHAGADQLQPKETDMAKKAKKTAPKAKKAAVRKQVAKKGKAR